VEGLAAHAEHLARQRDRVVGLLRGDEPVGIGHRPSLSRAKKAAAFFRISRSCRRVRFSRQAPELLSLLGGQALALAGVDVGLLDPIAQGLVGDERSEVRVSRTASRRNSGGYGGLVGGIDSSLPESFDQALRCRRNRGQTSCMGSTFEDEAGLDERRGGNDRTSTMLVADATGSVLAPS
jgi:hypothetical protein